MDTTLGQRELGPMRALYVVTMTLPVTVFVSRTT